MVLPRARLPVTAQAMPKVARLPVVRQVTVLIKLRRRVSLAVYLYAILLFKTIGITTVIDHGFSADV